MLQKLRHVGLYCKIKINKYVTNTYVPIPSTFT